MEHSKDSPPFISIVIPMYNEERYIGACLRSILQQDYPKDQYEIIVVDGRSEDRSREIVLEMGKDHPNIRLLDNPKRTTPAGFNLGIQGAKGEIINVMGGHSYIEQHYLREIIAGLNRTGADCVSPVTIAVGETPKAQVIALAMRSRFGVGGSPSRVSKEEGYVDSSNFGAYRKGVFDKIGLFDERFSASNEDYEFDRRLIDAGGTIYLIPSARAYLYVRRSFKHLFRQYFRYGRWKVEVLRKVRGAFLLRYQIPPLFVLSLLVLGVTAFFSLPGRILFWSEMGIYLSAVLSASLWTGVGSSVHYIPRLFLAFITLHVGFGSGFLWGMMVGLIDRVRSWRTGNGRREAAMKD